MVVVDDQNDDIAIERHQPRPRQSLSYHHSIVADLPSPTLSPARRDLERWEPPPTSCYAESTVTASTLPSDDDEHPFEEIKSNATTEVVSHRHRQLLASTLASAEKQLRQDHENHNEERRQDAEELQAYHYLMRLQPDSAKRNF